MLTPADIRKLITTEDAVPKLFLEPGPAVVLYRPRRSGLERSRHLRSYSDVDDFEHNLVGAFSRAALRRPDSQEHWLYHALWFTDKPLHTEYRRAVQRPFQENRMEGYEAMVRDIAAEHVRAIRLRSDPRFDLVRDFAQPFALKVIATILGTDPAAITRFWQALAEITEYENMNDYPRQPGLDRDINQLIEHHLALKDPQGAFGDLVRLFSEGRPVGGSARARYILGGYAASLYFAGTDTAAMTLANVLILLERFGLWEKAVGAALVGDMTYLSGVIEETMRLLPGFPASAARTVKPITLKGGLQLHAGELVIAWLASANRDPDVFADPLAFRTDRNFGKVPHLTMGRYAHYCLGAPLARLELRVALPMLLTELPGLRREPGTEPKRTLGRVNRVISDPYTYDPAA